MSPLARIAAFAVALLLVGGTAYGVGAAVGPVRRDDPPPAHEHETPPATTTTTVHDHN